MAIDRKWYKKSGLKLPSGDVFRIIAVCFDVIITLSVVAGKLNDNIAAQIYTFWVFSVGYLLASGTLLAFKTCLICVNIRRHTKDTEKRWERCVAWFEFIMGALTIVMGGLYLFGENLPRSVYPGVHRRQLKTGLLGGSLIGNLFLTVVEKGFDWSGGWDKIKTVDAKHKRWSDLLGLLSAVVLFDQSLTGFFMIVYEIKVDSTDITCDVFTNVISIVACICSCILFTLLIAFVG
jgi:uncharacterized membrane protein